MCTPPTKERVQFELTYRTVSLVFKKNDIQVVLTKYSPETLLMNFDSSNTPTFHGPSLCHSLMSTLCFHTIKRKILFL